MTSMIISIGSNGKATRRHSCEAMCYIYCDVVLPKEFLNCLRTRETYGFLIFMLLKAYSCVCVAGLNEKIIFSWNSLPTN